MEEDIKKLEKLIQDCKECKFATCEQCEISYTEVKAIQNLIARNKELEKNYINPSKARISYYDTKKGTQVVIEGFVPKSKIKELKEKVHNKLDENGITRGYQIIIDEYFEELLD